MDDIVVSNELVCNQTSEKFEPFQNVSVPLKSFSAHLLHINLF